MKFNTTYKPLIGFKQTIKEIANIKETLNTYMLQHYKLVNVIPPLLSEENNPISIDYELKTRGVAFESRENQILKLFLSHTNWARELLRRMDFQPQHGIFFEASTVWRDLEETAVSTITRHELTYAFAIQETNLEQEVENLTHKLYALIYQMAIKINKEYKIKNIFPSQPHFVSSQQLENEMPNLAVSARENELILNERAFFLTEAGTILFSGKNHTHIPLQFYNLRFFNQIIMFDRNNSAPLKVASIAVLAGGKQLANQLTLHGHGKMASVPLYQANINDERKFIEIKISLPRLAMALLAKGHLGEIQAGITSSEVDTIKNRYGIDIY